MKQLMAAGLLAFGLVVASACDKLLPTQPTKQECEINNTGTLSVTNNSKRGLDYNIVIDGISYGTVVVGSKGTYTLVAGPHLLEIRYAGHAGDACTASVPTIIQCQNTGLSCDG